MYKMTKEVVKNILDSVNVNTLLKNMMTLRLTTSIVNLFVLTIQAYTRDDNSNMELLNLFKTFRKGISSNVKNIGDDKMVKKFLTLFKNNVKDIVHFHLKKDKKIDERQYRYVCYVDFPLFQKALDDEKIFDRRLDENIFKKMIDFYFKDLLENPVIGKSNDKTLARFIELMIIL